MRTAAADGLTRRETVYRNPVPRYHKLYLALREKILRNEWAQGDPLPSEIAISKSYGVSRVTVRRALALLAEENLLHRFQGRGSFVSPRVNARPVTASIGAQLDNATNLGRQTTVKLETFEYMSAPDEAQVALGCDPDSEIQHSVRIRHLGERPISLIRTYVPADIGRQLNKHDLLQSTPILVLIEERAPIAYADQSITATIADDVLSAALNIPIGAPVLQVERVVVGESGRQLMHSKAFYNPTYYNYSMTLRKEGAHGKVDEVNIYD